MITGTVWGVTLIVVGLVVTLAATQVFLTSLFRERADAARRRLRAGPVSATLIGIVPFWVLFAVGVGAAKVFELGGAIAFSGLILLAAFGLGAVASEVGERLPSSGPGAAPWRAQVRGSVALSLASLLPVAGWFVVFPLAVFAGFGAWIASFAGARAAEPAPRTAEVTPAPAETLA